MRPDVQRKGRRDVSKNILVHQVKRESLKLDKSSPILPRILATNSVSLLAGADHEQFWWCQKTLEYFISCDGMKSRSLSGSIWSISRCFLKVFQRNKVRDVWSSTAGVDDTEYSVFHGSGLYEFSQLSVTDVVWLVKDSPSKAYSLDSVPTWFVKQLIQHLALFLTTFFNKSLSLSYLPEVFRPRSCLSSKSLSSIQLTISRSRISLSFPKSWNDVLMKGCWFICRRTISSIRLSMRPFDRLPYWWWCQMCCSLLIKAG